MFSTKMYIFANIVMMLSILIELKTLKSKVTEKKSIIGTPYIISFIVLVLNIFMALVLISDYFRKSSVNLHSLLQTFVNIQLLIFCILIFKTSSTKKK